MGESWVGEPIKIWILESREEDMEIAKGSL